MVIGEDENLILDAYRMARFYSQNPNVFLDMPLSELRVHCLRTQRMQQLDAAERARNEDND